MMEHKPIHSLPQLKANRKSLRNKLTPAEAKLWSMLKNWQLYDRKFIRQHSIENYIADFYCASEQLIVELDGQVHFNDMVMKYDEKRTVTLNELGFRVIRFENKMVFQDPDGVLREITAHFKGERRLLLEELLW